MYITGTRAPIAWERENDIPPGEPYFEASEFPTGDGVIRADQTMKILYREQPPPSPLSPPTLEERIDGLEADKADRAELDAISEAIERGLTT